MYKKIVRLETKMIKPHVKNRLKEIFESTVESGIKYDGTIESVDYYSMFCKAIAQVAAYQ